MLNAVRDRNAIILGVLEVPKLQHLWTADGPTPAALRIRDTSGADVDPTTLTWVLLAFDLFNATGALTLNRMFDSLMNQIEIWFSILSRRLLGRSSFASLKELSAGIRQFIEYFNATTAKPFKWTFTGIPLRA